METKIKSLQEIMQEAGIKRPEQVDIDFSDLELVKQLLESEFQGVKPTAKEFYLGQLYAFRLAYQRLLEEQKEQKAQERKKMLTQMWTFQQMYDRAYEYGKLIGTQEGFDFVLDKHNEKVFELLCLYFTNDPEFEKRELDGMTFSLNKGIWLQSPIRGSGKSVMLKCFTFNKRSCFGYKHTTELASMFQRGGFEAVDNFIGTLPQPASPTNFYQSEVGFMYDELFGEDKVNHMGSPLLLSEYIINKLYDFSNNKKKEKWKFHCTSNSDGQDIETRSGKNYRSRMRDMFNLIKLNGIDRRK